MGCRTRHFKEKCDCAAQQAPFTLQKMLNGSSIIHSIDWEMFGGKLLSSSKCHTSVHFKFHLSLLEMQKYEAWFTFYMQKKS